jgi:3-deoxy-D-manno-octulosonate 8-phosphate phosphatase KdsC-like HAD superfamily phosphatase
MRALLTDLDGTLRDGAAGVPAANWEALRRLGRHGVTRVVATGRSLHHVERVLEREAPVDWVIFASGAGWRRWPDGPCRALPGLSPRRAAELGVWLDALGLSYSLHDPVPASHCFQFREGRLDGTDFRLRLERNRRHGRPLPAGPPVPDLWPRGASQALVIVPPGEDWPVRLAAGAPDLRLLHSTSPLDGRSQWIELQPAGVGKGAAAATLLAELGIGREGCLAVGNDFNDLDLLEWAGRAAVVGNAPPELRARFTTWAACPEGGLAQAIEDGWSREAAD